MQANKQKLFKYLKSQNLMALATYSRSIWICTVYYVIDNDFNLYFVTSRKTKHGKMIEKNPRVACSIFDSHQKNKDYKVGAQVRGRVTIPRNAEKVKWALKIWNLHNPGLAHIINFKNMKEKVISAKIYKITPDRIQFFNQKLYGDDDYEIFNF